MTEKIAYITCIKNESDIITQNLAYHVIIGIRRFYIMFNGADAATHQAVNRAFKRFKALHDDITLETYQDDDPTYRQPERMTMMANCAHSDGAAWIVPVDADELIRLPEGHQTLPDVLSAINADHGYINCEWIDYLPDDPDQPATPFYGWNRRFISPRKESKVIVKWKPGMRFGDGHHLITTHRVEIENPGILVAHYPARSKIFLENKISIIGNAFVKRFGPDSGRPQVKNWHHLIADKKNFVQAKWAAITKSRKTRPTERDPFFLIRYHFLSPKQETK